MERKGTVAQVLGPVVDVEFSEGSLPEINEALTVELDGSWKSPSTLAGTRSAALCSLPVKGLAGALA